MPSMAGALESKDEQRVSMPVSTYINMSKRAELADLLEKQNAELIERINDYIIENQALRAMEKDEDKATEKELNWYRFNYVPRTGWGITAGGFYNPIDGDFDLGIGFGYQFRF